MIPVSLLNFLSGLAAGAGINMLTSIEGGSNAAHGSIIVDSVAWILAAAVLAYVAHVAETVDKEASLVIDVNLSPAEKREVYAAYARKVRWRYRIALILVAVLTVAAVILVPGL